MRHLIRALTTASEIFILTPKKIQETYRDVLERLQRQVETLAVSGRVSLALRGDGGEP